MNVLQGMRSWSRDGFSEEQKRRADQLLEKSMQQLPKLKANEESTLRAVGVKNTFLLQTRTSAASTRTPSAAGGASSRPMSGLSGTTSSSATRPASTGGRRVSAHANLGPLPREPAPGARPTVKEVSEEHARYVEEMVNLGVMSTTRPDVLSNDVKTPSYSCSPVKKTKSSRSSRPVTAPPGASPSPMAGSGGYFTTGSGGILVGDSAASSSTARPRSSSIYKSPAVMMTDRQIAMLGRGGRLFSAGSGRNAAAANAGTKSVNLTAAAARLSQAKRSTSRPSTAGRFSSMSSSRHDTDHSGITEPEDAILDPPLNVEEQAANRRKR
ncbi:unnamed protein product, partial [Amoebophrya sp. A25]|eukprot:GSA25T00004491001.1